MEKLLGIKEASEYLNVCIETLRLWDKQGKLNSLKTCGGHRRYRLSDLDNFLNGNNHNFDSDIFDGRIFTDETINWKDIKVGDTVLHGDRNFEYVTITNIYGNCWEYINQDGYYRETKPYYCHWKVMGQKDMSNTRNGKGKLIKIIVENE